MPKPAKHQNQLHRLRALESHTFMTGLGIQQFLKALLSENSLAVQGLGLSALTARVQPNKYINEAL